jgi:hypothetical protein
MKLLGKTYTDELGEVHPSFTVYQHSILVGAAAQALLRYYPELRRERGLPYFFSLHDIGKVSPGFQAMLSCAITANNGKSSFQGTEGVDFGILKDCHKYCRHHEEITDWHFCEENPTVMHKKGSEILKMHHGGTRCRAQRDAESVGDMQGGIDWVAERKNLVLQLRAFFPEGAIPPKKFLKKNYDILIGILTIADWIGSDEAVFPPDPTDEAYPFKKGMEDNLETLVSRASAALSSYKITGRSPLIPGMEFEDVFYPYSQRELQKLLIE